MEKDIHVHSPSKGQSNKKPVPQSSKCKLKFKYAASPDGVDTNILLLLHGLGDTLQPFFNLGNKLQLPQTAVMALQAPDLIPLMGECYQWYPSFNMMTGEELSPSHPEQKKGIITTGILLTELIQHLIQDCHYQAQHIFLFGFSQGGTVALNQVLQGPIRNLGGVVSIAGYEPFLSSSSQLPSVKYDGPILVLQGEKDPVIGSKANGEKMFSQIKNACTSTNNNSDRLQQIFIPNKSEHSMPSNQSEWRYIHAFFAKHMPRRNLRLEKMSDVYEIQLN
ncbi:Phospholipase/Carboxylesterase-domain-containing protein [Cunninghamella echinulata]|nr:Phospholipase/Carboxylesterase-domain-containing protein [Cunninghamella echinulata]